MLGEKIPPRRVSRQRLNDSLHQLILVRAGQIEDGFHLDAIGREASNLGAFFFRAIVSPPTAFGIKAASYKRNTKPKKDPADHLIPEQTVLLARHCTPSPHTCVAGIPASRWMG